MNLKKLINKRYSVRAYLPREVEKEKIDYILECVRLAPSANNKQPWFLYIVTSGEKKAIIKESYNREWFKIAPMYIVVCADPLQSWKRTNTDNKDHYEIDASIVSEHICLAAEDAGIGTCWVCNFDADVLRKGINLPENHIPIAIFPLGYIDEKNSKPTEKNRKTVDEITKWI